MSTVLTERELKAAVAEGRLILDGKDGSVEGLKYDFALGPWMLFGGKAPINAANLSENERANLVVKPGELVYVMSEEKLELPPDVKADLSLKRKISHLGIMVLGGSSVDPGYKGRLVFALYNLSTRPFPLQMGRKLIAAQFYKLSPEETPPPGTRVPEALYEFPNDLVQLMQIYQPATTEGLRQLVNELTESLEDLRHQVQTKEEWFDRFQRSLDTVTQSVATLTQNVDKLREGLLEEVSARKVGVANIAAGVRVNNALIGTGIAVVAAVVGGIIVHVMKL